MKSWVSSQHHRNQAWWHEIKISALGMWRVKGKGFEAILELHSKLEVNLNYIGSHFR